ncbi:hypothetical protein M231_01116 [Tremella mesenterica]|uniref:Cytochrome b561 domain-containing protein n=1 Tax=Tremella mesenterica TaxID=5217 RepID=A0A4V1M4U8_TREME|nr:hypothetical protein M231_01116 [Tremella mesenterica]
MVILWPNSDGSVTLSQRSVPGHAQPKLVSSPPSVASLSASSYSNTSNTQLTFSIPSTSTTSQPLIYAYSATNPSSSSPDAIIKIHTSFGTTTLDLSAALSSGQVSTSTGGGSSPSKALIAHVVLGVLSTAFFIPIGALVPRIARGLTGKRWWFATHQAVQGVIGLGMVVAAFVIAVWNFDGGINSSHRLFGALMFIFMLVQSSLGMFVHYIKIARHRFTAESGRGPSNFIHMIFGAVTVCVGFWTTWEGMNSEWPDAVGTKAPIGLKVGYWFWVSILALSYLLGLAFLLPRQLRMERERREGNIRMESFKAKLASIGGA